MYSKTNKGTGIRLLILAFYLVICLIGIYKIKQTSAYSYDTIQINRIAAAIESNWMDLAKGDYSTFIYPFAVLDSADTLLYTWNDPESVTLQDVMRHSDVSLPIRQNGTIVGTVIIQTHTLSEQHRQETQTQCQMILCGIFLLGLVLMLLYHHYLNRTIIKPFQQLDEFAKKLSLGDFDAPLQIQGNSSFIPFAQGLEVMRDELHTARQREYEANQSKKALVASLSHDIKTPVTSIQLAVELLQFKVQDEELKERLDAIMTKTTQIDHLVTDLFHSTMEDMEELQVSPREVYSTEIIALIRDADVSHNVQALELPECMVCIDPIRLEQVFTNILYNSYKYAKTEIDISGSIASEYLQIVIQDYGPGVDSEELPCIFNRFYRGSNVGSQTGSGLGLYICKCLIDKMEGELYSNNNDKGFETIIKLPLA